MGKGWTRNAYGVKDGANMYRTIKGVRWEWWSAGNIGALRAAGLRCQKSGSEIFIHSDDEERARTLIRRAVARVENALRTAGVTVTIEDRLSQHEAA